MADIASLAAYLSTFDRRPSLPTGFRYDNTVWRIIDGEPRDFLMKRHVKLCGRCRSALCRNRVSHRLSKFDLEYALSQHCYQPGGCDIGELRIFHSILDTGVVRSLIQSPEHVNGEELEDITIVLVTGDGSCGIHKNGKIWLVGENDEQRQQRYGEQVFGTFRKWLRDLKTWLAGSPARKPGPQYMPEVWGALSGKGYWEFHVMGVRRTSPVLSPEEVRERQPFQLRRPLPSFYSVFSGYMTRMYEKDAAATAEVDGLDELD
ncbi:hypothetical protein GGS26DRAFT_602275 [Hypomontagnella submonticulosa]|nr:hypothetical protein GGS26DRAFT_602275 [Hypomontagnella submonticulosa]